MKSLAVLLAASIAVNLVLGLMLVRQTNAPAPASSGAAASGPSTASPATGSTAARKGGEPTPPVEAAANAGSASGPSVGKSPASTEDMHQLVVQLRTAGYSPAVIRAVVNQLISERLAAKQPWVNLPYWKAPERSSQAAAAQRALNQERQSLYESLLGADALPSASMDPALRTRRYGNLSDDKINAVARIERDYSEMRSEAMAERRNTGGIAAAENLQQTQEMMEREKMADLASILTPDELLQYEMRQSPSASTLINHLRNVDVSEAEYATLFAAQKAFDAANPRRIVTDANGVVSANSFQQRQAAQAALNEQMRGVLGESRFYDYLESADSNYGTIVRTLAAFPAINKSTTYQVYQLQTELQREMTSISRDNSGAASADRIAVMRATAEDYNNRLEALVGVDAANAYRKQGSGRIFTSLRNAPRTATPR